MPADHGTSGGFCMACGRPAAACAGCGRHLDPPRFCADCGRRLAVTVTPGGFRARCRDHGDLPEVRTT